jgi:hypothetical protein
VIQEGQEEDGLFEDGKGLTSSTLSDDDDDDDD